MFAIKQIWQTILQLPIKIPYVETVLINLIRYTHGIFKSIEHNPSYTIMSLNKRMCLDLQDLTAPRYHCVYHKREPTHIVICTTKRILYMQVHSTIKPPESAPPQRKIIDNSLTNFQALTTFPKKIEKTSE